MRLMVEDEDAESWIMLMMVGDLRLKPFGHDGPFGNGTFSSPVVVLFHPQACLAFTADI